ncbi:MAG: glycosyl transferase family 2 [Acidobacteria bacterium]|nr:MAG: glycosyl transferase family 2 [Acidobacteriota bacterium]
MAEETFLSDEFVRRLSAVGEVDILVGVPTFNNRHTIEKVVNAVQLGLVKYFPRERIVLINPDGGSKDGTPEAVRNCAIQDFRTLLSSSPLRTIHRISTTYGGVDGRSSAWRIIMASADLLRAKACAVLSPDLESISPEWIEALVRPVYKEQYDLVTPIYHRHKYDGLLVNNIIAPAVRAVYGVEVREPVGGDLGFSGRLACHYLEQDVWHEEYVRARTEIWMTTRAIADGYKLCQSYLGPKIHTPDASTQNIVTTIREALGALFRCMENQQSFWLSRNEPPQTAPVFGFEYSSGLEPRRVNRKKLLTMFQNGLDHLAPILESILSAETLGQIQGAAQQNEKHFHFPDELWVKTIYEFAASYHHSVMNRDHLLQALTPIYRGRIYSVVLENHRADAEQIEKRREALCQEYERQRPHLVERWARKA